jgi:hypothetical protein
MRGGPDTPPPTFFMYNSIYVKIVRIMKTQNKYPFDSAIVGLNNAYHTIGDGSFYINSDCILVRDKILSIGKEYIIFDYSAGTGIKMSDVFLADCFYNEGVIHLIVEDVRAHGQFTVKHCLDCAENDCPWILVDLNYFHDLQDAKAVRDFCGCNDKLKRPNGDSTFRVNEDLLDFEF